MTEKVSREVSKEVLLSQVRSLSNEITDYFQLDPETAQRNFKLKLEGKTYKIVNKRQEQAELQKKWLSRIKVSYTSSVEKFFRIWDLLQNNPELDICVVSDSLGNKRIFQIHKLGVRLECVCLTKNEVATISENFTTFLNSINSKNISQEEYEKFVEWQNMIAGPNNELHEQIAKVSWCDQRYHWKSTGYEMSSKYGANVFASYCKFFTKLGTCTNPNCKFVHDPRTIAICRDFFAKGSCHYGDKCRMTHTSIGSEYIVPQCKYNLRRECKYAHGVEIMFGRPDKEISHCPYIHSEVAELKYPLCRQFSHIGYCYRGLSCKFPHLWDCPDERYTGQCFLIHCKFPHRQLDVNPLEVNRVLLEDIPATDYLLPPLSTKKHRSSSGGWYGLKTNQQSIDIRARTPATEPNHPKSTYPLLLSDGSRSESESEESTTSSDFSEFSEGELDADFIRI